MPVTFPAHQAAVLPLKLRFPSRFDGLALAVGAAGPDIFYGLGGEWWFAHGPRSLPLIVPIVVAYCLLLRRFALPGLFRYAPSVAGADLRVFGAMADGRPPLARTIASAAIGVLSHQAWDSVTHSNHPVAEWLGLDRTIATVDLGPIGTLTGAKILQYASHSLGSLVTVGLLIVIARRRPPGLLDGPDVDRLLTQPRPNPWPAIGAGVGAVAIGLALWPMVGARGPFVLIDVLVVSLLMVGATIEWRFRPSLRTTG